MGQFAPFARNPNASHGVTKLRTSLAVILILTALLLACTSEPANPPPQAGNDAVPQVAATAVAVALRSELYSDRNSDASSWRIHTPRVQSKVPRLPRHFTRLGKQPAEVTQPEHPSGRRGSTASQSLCSANLSDLKKNLPEEGGLPSPTKATKGTPPALTDRPYVAPIRALGTIFPSPQRIYTPGSKNRLTGQMREVKDRTTDRTKASATPQTKKRLPPRPRRPIYRRLLQAIWSEQTKVSKRSNTVA